MSRKGNCYDNAPVESFFSSLKNELVRHRQFANRAEARYAIAEYIERFYNRQRLHQALGYRSPEEFEQQVGESLSRCPLFRGHLSLTLLFFSGLCTPKMRSTEHLLRRTAPGRQEMREKSDLGAPTTLPRQVLRATH
jgi:hypothetical protein